MDRVIDFLKSEDADIVCLQEAGTEGVDLSPSKINIFEEVMRALGYEGEFVSIMGSRNSDGFWNIGQATYSRLRMTNVKKSFYHLQEYKEYEDWWKNRFKWPRAVLITEFDIGGVGLVVGNTHMPVTPKATITKYQLEAARRLRKLMDQFGSYILSGDMNTPYGTKTHEILSRGLVDVTDPKQSTLHPTIHKVGHLGYHADYVFYKGKRIKHISTKIPVVDASDHLPIVCEFELGKHTEKTG